MIVVQINATCGIGSTGKISVGISRVLAGNEIENYIFYSCKSNGYPYGIRCSDEKHLKIQALKSRILGNYGFNSQKATRKMIAQLERIQPDIVHLQNIHGHDCDLAMLFTYFKEKKTKVFWTFHDCWAFTGYCPHFTLAKCDKWKTECKQCVQYRDYSWFFDRSCQLFQKKKALFRNVDLTIITPSQWLADKVKESFLQDCRIKVIHNGIDLSVFKPIQSDFREKYGLENKKVILGVSFDWGMKKGLDVYITLAKRLPDDYRIVLVGTDAKTDRVLPKNIMSVHRTQDQQELAGIYSAADLFLNPSREENLPTVDIESLACGTPVLTFRTGGGPEIVNQTCGSVVDCDDVDALEKEIIRICTDKPYSSRMCVSRARKFDQNERFKEYLELYERVIAAGTEGN